MTDSRDTGLVGLHGLRLEVAGVSEQGPRPENQDAFLIEGFAESGVVAVADGMGGERSGRLAADLALRALLDGGPIRSLDDARRAVRGADAAVSRSAEENPGEHGGMGCALGMLALVSQRGDGAGWIGAHVGDVRIISRSPDGAVRLETRDHTPAFARWEAGEISLDEIPDTAGANRLQRAVGRGGEADVTWLPARAGWSWLLVSDGVYKVMRLDELGEYMASSDAVAACEAIRVKVLERGPEDNFTAVLVRAIGGAQPMDPMTRTDPIPGPAAQRRSGSSAFATLLALLALAASGFAVWMALQARDGARHAEVQRLRLEVDSLQSQVRALAEPFGPTAPPVQIDTTLPAPVSPTPR